MKIERAQHFYTYTSRPQSRSLLTSESSIELVVVLRLREVDALLSGVTPPVGVLKWFSSNVNDSPDPSPVSSVNVRTLPNVISSISVLVSSSIIPLDDSVSLLSLIAKASTPDCNSLSATSDSTVSWLDWLLVSWAFSAVTVSLLSTSVAAAAVSLPHTTSSASFWLSLTLVSQSLLVFVMLVVSVWACSLSSGERIGVE